ncbi:MAG: DUF2783 domain-containing protein [Hyphomicrobiaceae bacterium]
MTNDKLDTSFRLADGGDDVYAALIAAHESLSDADSARLNARLILLLANQVGDPAIVIAAIRKARRDLGPTRHPR